MTPLLVRVRNAPLLSAQETSAGRGSLLKDRADRGERESRDQGGARQQLRCAARAGGKRKGRGTYMKIKCKIK